MAIFDNSTAFKDVSEETKRLCRGGGEGRLARRDPSMYGDHHKCNLCGEAAKYIAHDTHWCKYCLDTKEYPQLTGMTQDERDAYRAEAMSKIGKTSVVNVKNMGKVGF